MTLVDIAGLTRKPSRVGHARRVGPSVWMPGQTRHDKP